MTKDEIFVAMEKAYTGAGSTVEGSFAGDLLRACADGCAELWSTEIDGLEERAFVASAAGEWLTRVCADRGVERRAGEDDETLRSRALESLKRQGASGNADDYAAWCGTVEGLLRVRVLPLARGARQTRSMKTCGSISAQFAIFRESAERSWQRSCGDCAASAPSHRTAGGAAETAKRF